MRKVANIYGGPCNDRMRIFLPSRRRLLKQKSTKTKQGEVKNLMVFRVHFGIDKGRKGVSKKWVTLFMDGPQQ